VSENGHQVLTNHRWPIFWATWVLLSALCAIWAAATPISGSPDEPAHIVKAASVVRGELIGTPNGNGSMAVTVPDYIAYSQAAPCFAFHTDESAACMPPPPPNGGALATSTTLAGLYNPVYYALVGWPSLFFNDVSGIYAMRIVSGILTSLFLAATVLMICSWRRPTVPLLSTLVATPPMLLFLGGSVNPNALETTSIVAAFAAALSILRQPSQQLLSLRLAVLCLSAAIGVNARGLSPLWLAVAVLVPFMLTRRRVVLAVFSQVRTWMAVAVAALAAAFAVTWLLAANSLGAASESGPMQNVFPGTGASPLTGFVVTLESTFGSAQDMLGDFGWLDTMAPLGMFYAWAGILGALMLTALVVLKRRELAFSLVLTASFVLLPAVVQAAYIHTGGIIWQGRYALPLFGIMVLGISAVAGERLPSGRAIASRLSPVILIIWIAGQWLSFAVVLRRYAVGSDATLGAFLRAPEWVAPGGNFTWLIAYAAVLLVIAFVVWWTASHEQLTRPARPALRRAGMPNSHRA
jgi:hypothetical protein